MDVQPEIMSPKFFRINGVLASKNNLKPPHGPFLKTWGVFQNCPRYPNSEIPVPP